MPLNRFMVDDVEKFGQLVKDWGRSKKPLPRNKQEFEKQLTEAGIKPTWPTGKNEIVNVIVEKVPLGVLHLLAAAPELYDESEAFLSKPGQSYPLPDYYEMDAFHAKPKVGDNIRFNNKRTGDYTIAHCA